MTDGIQQDFKIWCQRTFDFMPGKQFFVPNYLKDQTYKCLDLETQDYGRIFKVGNPASK